MYQTYMDIHGHHDWFFQLWFFGLGACVGSFLNVCILRLPAGRSIVTPRSQCGCGKPIAWYDNIPIFSWFLLGGKARCCGRPFSIRYPLIEFATALVFWWCWRSLLPGAGLAGMIFFSLLLLGAIVDLEHMILPDVSTIGGMLVGVILSFVLPQIHQINPTGVWMVDGMRGALMAVIGVLVGTGVVFWLRELGELILKKEAMGYGDILLMGCIGAFCGWQGALFALAGGAVIGCLVLLPWMMFSNLFGKGGDAQKAGAGEPVAVSPRAVARAEGEGWPADETVAPAMSVTAESSAKVENAPTSGEVEAAPTGPAFGVAIPFGPFLALAGFIYYIAFGPGVRAYFEQARQVFFTVSGGY